MSLIPYTKIGRYEYNKQVDSTGDADPSANRLNCFATWAVDTISAMRLTLVVLALLFSSQAAVAQERPARVQLRQGIPEYYKAFRSIEQKDNLTRVVLRNGLTIVIEEFPAAPLASITTLIDAGSLQSSTTPPVASIIALLRFEAVEREARARGGFAEAGSEARSTWFTSTVPESEILQSLASHAALFSPESGFEGRMEAAMGAALKGAFSLNRLIHGESGELERRLGVLDRGAPDAAALTDFQARYFKPGNVVLALSGSVRRENVLPEIVEQFSGLPPGDAEPSAEGGEQGGSSEGSFQYHYARENRPGFQVVMAYPVTQPGHQDEPALRILTYLLTEGRAALLKLPQEDGPADFRPQARIESTPAGTFFLIDAVPAPDEVDAVELRILGLLESLKKGLLPDLVLDRARALFVNDYYRSLEALGDRSRSLAEQYRDRLQTRQEVLEPFLNVSREDIQRVARRYFEMSNLTLLEFDSEESEPRTYTAETYLDALSILLPPAAEKQSSFLQIFSAPSEIEAFQPPDFEVSFLRKDLKRTSILRGPEIYLEEMHTIPVVHLGFLFPGGRIGEQTSDAGITELALRSLINGFERVEGNLSLAEIEKKGVRYWTTNQADFFGVQVATISSAVRDVVWEMVTWLRQPELVEEDIEKARAALLRDLEFKATDDRETLEAEVRQKLFPGHPYSLPSAGTRETVRKISIEQVQEWLGNQIINVNPSIFLVGDLDGTSFLSEFISELSDRRYQNREPVRRAVDESGRQEGWPGYAVASNLASRQLMVGFPGPAEGLYPNQMLDIAEILLGGRSGWLTREALRKQDLADRVDFWRKEYVNGGALYFLLSEVTPSQMGRDPEKHLLSALSGFSASALERREFLNAMIGAMTRFHYNRFRGDEYLRELALAMFAGREADFRQKYLLSIKQTTPGEVDAALSRYIEVGE